MTTKKTDLELTKQLPDGTEINCKFKSPSKLTYKVALEYLQKEDRYAAFETLFNSTLIETDYEGDLKEDEYTKVLFFGDLATNYLDFSGIKVDIDKFEDRFEVTIGKKKFTLRYPSKEEYKEIFNRNVKNFMDAWEYIYSTLKTEGDEITDIKQFAAASNIPSVILYSKQMQLKKK